MVRGNAYIGQNITIYFFIEEKKKSIKSYILLSYLYSKNPYLLFIKHSSLRILDSSTETPINLLNYLMHCITHSDSSLVASPLHLNVDQL